jgi:hypothetical protein
MQRIVKVGVALAASLSIVAVNAVPVSATGHEFIANKLGKTKGKQTDAAVFKTGAGTLECNTVSSTGEITELKSAVHKETLTYTNCSAFGYPSVKITAVHFEYSANESARLESAVTITPEGAGCHITIPAQTVEGLTYENKPSKENRVGERLRHPLERQRPRVRHGRKLRRHVHRWHDRRTGRRQHRMEITTKRS